jgi:hypothetical protein
MNKEPVNIKDDYNPKFISWCTSYEQEVEAFRGLIEAHPSDERELRNEYQELTGKRYYSER